MDEPDFNESALLPIEIDLFNGLENENYSWRTETYIISVVFISVFIVGVIGNGIMILIFVRHRVMRNVPNTIMLSLAVGDMLSIVTNVPYLIIIYTMESWPLGISMCKLFETSMRISPGVSAFTLTVFTAERYCAIINPARRRLCNKSFTLKMVIILTWTFSILLATPAIVFTSLREIQLVTVKLVLCTPVPEYFPLIYVKRLVIFTFLTYYMIPLFIMACFCTLMARHLVASAYKLSGEQSHQQSSQIQEVKIILKFVCIFTVCFMPQHIFSLWFRFHPNAMEDYNDFWHLFRVTGYCLISINFCSKPIVLYFDSKTFRGYIDHYLFFCFNSSKKLTDISVNEASNSSLHQNFITDFSN